MDMTLPPTAKAWDTLAEIRRISAQTDEIRRQSTRDHHETNDVILELVSLSIFLFLIKYFTHRDWWSVWAEAAVLVFSFFHVVLALYGAESARTGRGLLVVAFDRLSAEPLLMILPVRQHASRAAGGGGRG